MISTLRDAWVSGKAQASLNLGNLIDQLYRTACRGEVRLLYYRINHVNLGGAVPDPIEAGVSAKVNLKACAPLADTLGCAVLKGLACAATFNY
jgi:hypothetical protein